MEIRIENKDLKENLMSRLQNQFIEDLLEDSDKLHKIYLYHKGERILEGVMSKDVLLGTLWLDEHVAMYFESKPVEEVLQDSKKSKGRNKESKKR